MSTPEEEIAVAALTGFANNNTNNTNDAASRKRKGPRPKIKYPVEPRRIQVIPKRKGYMNHSYSDFTGVPPDSEYKLPASFEEMSFPEKVHDILSHVDYSKWISWQDHGRAFRVIVPVMFENNVCPKYFGHKRYSSFLRQLNNHGFKHISKGVDRNCYYHECFLRGLPHLCRYMPAPKDARRQIPDPDNEPDLAAISRLYPVPTSTRPSMAAAPAPVPRPSAVPTQDGTASSPVLSPTTVVTTTTTAGEKKGMDRAAALAEINDLRARLASKVPTAFPSSSSNTDDGLPPAKRMALSTPVLATGSVGQIPVSQLLPMPQAFPSRRGVSDIESMLQTNAIINVMRTQQEEQKAIQEIQVQQKLQELCTRQKLQEIQQQHQIQEMKAQQTIQKLQIQQQLKEFQKQQALEELQKIKAQMKLQGLQGGLPQPPSSSSSQPSTSTSLLGGLPISSSSTNGSGGFSNSAIAEFLRSKKRFV